MAKLPALIQGDLQRMKKYNIFAGGTIVALLWVATMHFIDRALLDALFVTLLFVDLVSMPAILVAVSLFYEKHEGHFRPCWYLPFDTANMSDQKCSPMPLCLAYFDHSIRLRPLHSRVPG